MKNVFDKRIFSGGRLLRFHFFIEDVDTESFLDTFDVGQEIGDLLDGVHLFLQVFVLEEVAQVGVAVRVGYAVQCQQALKIKNT